MTGMVLSRRDNSTRSSDVVAELGNDSRLMKDIEKGMVARLNGKVKSWSAAKEELGIR